MWKKEIKKASLLNETLIKVSLYIEEAQGFDKNEFPHQLAPVLTHKKKMNE